MTSFTKKTILRVGIAHISVLLSAVSALAGTHYNVDLNKTEIVRLPENAGAVVIGNPNIADVSVHSANTLFVVGRGYGETNLIVLNAAGHTIMDANIQVSNTVSRHGVRLYNGKSRESYACTPYCQPTPILGDNPNFIGNNAGTSVANTNNATTATPTSAPTSSDAFSSSASSSSSSGSSSSSQPQSFGSGSDF